MDKKKAIGLGIVGGVAVFGAGSTVTVHAAELSATRYPNLTLSERVSATRYFNEDGSFKASLVDVDAVELRDEESGAALYHLTKSAGKVYISKIKGDTAPASESMIKEVLRKDFEGGLVSAFTTLDGTEAKYKLREIFSFNSLVDGLSFSKSGFEKKLSAVLNVKGLSKSGVTNKTTLNFSGYGFEELKAAIFTKTSELNNQDGVVGKPSTRTYFVEGNPTELDFLDLPTLFGNNTEVNLTVYALDVVTLFADGGSSGITSKELVGVSNEVENVLDGLGFNQSSRVLEAVVGLGYKVNVDIQHPLSRKETTDANSSVKFISENKAEVTIQEVAHDTTGNLLRDSQTQNRDKTTYNFNNFERTVALLIEGRGFFAPGDALITVKDTDTVHIMSKDTNNKGVHYVQNGNLKSSVLASMDRSYYLDFVTTFGELTDVNETITIKQISAIDGGTTEDYVFNIRVDREAPKIVSETIADTVVKTEVGSSVYGDTPKLNVSVSDDIELRVVELHYVDIYGVSKTITKQVTGKSSVLEIPLPAGEYTKLVVKDSVGRTTEKVLSYKIKAMNEDNYTVNFDITNGVTLGGKTFIRSDVEGSVKIKADTPVKEVRAYVNGNLISTIPAGGTDKEITLTGIMSNLTQIENLLYIELEGESGETLYRSIKLYRDTTPLEIEGVRGLSSTPLVGGDTAFVSGTSLEFTLVPRLTDTVGLDYVEVKNITTGSVIRVGANAEGLANITLSEEGEYKFNVVDVFGNAKEYTLSDLGTVFAGSTQVNFVNSRTEITLTSDNGADYTDSNGGKWYKDASSVSYTIKNLEGISSYEIDVNGVTVATGTYQITDFMHGNGVNLEGIIDANTIKQNIQNGVVRVTVKVRDLITNALSTKVVILNVDSVTPEIINAQLVKGSFTNTTEGNFADANGVTLRLTGTDKSGTSGAVTLITYVDGVEVRQSTNGSLDLDFTKTGVYTFKALDNLGRSSKEYTLAELLGVQSSKVVVDVNKPTLTVNEDSTFTLIDGKKWYKELPKFSVLATDTSALASLVVKVNGVEVSNVVAANNTSVSLSADIVDLSRFADTSELNVEIVTTDKSGNVTRDNRVYYVDNVAPTLQSLELLTEGLKEGSLTGGSSNTYGFYFKDIVSGRLVVSDGTGVGVQHVLVRANNSGVVSEVIAPVVNGVAEFNLPSGFKGNVEIVVVDKLGKESVLYQTDGIIHETDTIHVNNTKVALTTSTPIANTLDGGKLFNGVVNVGLQANTNYAGVHSVVIYLDGQEISRTEVDRTGVITVGGATVSLRDKNLATMISDTLEINKEGQNQEFKVVLTDRAGYTTTTVERVSIDRTAPQLSISYDANNQSGYYNTDRVATLVIDEINFNQSDVVFGGNVGEVSWTHNGSKHIATIRFTENGDYRWSVSYKDLVGNIGNTISEQVFTIDKNAPVVSVAYDNNDVSNGKFYKAPRTATITVSESNFDTTAFTVQGGVVNGWSSNGDTHTATVTFDRNGTYIWNFSVTDKAGNISNTYQSEEFVIDLTNPELRVEGVSNGAVYKGSVIPRVVFSDENIDSNSLRITITNNRIGDVVVNGDEDGDGVYTFNDLERIKLNDGVYTLTATVKDLAGNEVTSTVVYSVNRFGSEFATDSALLSGYYKQLPTGVFYTEITPVPLDKDNLVVELTVNGVSRQLTLGSDVVITESRTADGLYLYTYAVSDRLTQDEGVYSIYVRSVDLQGQFNDNSLQRANFVIDRTKPNIALSDIESNGVYDVAHKRVLITLTDNSQIDEDSIKVYVNGVEQTLVIEKGQVFVTLESADTPYDIKVVVRDLAGNESEVSLTNVIVSTNPIIRLLNWKYLTPTAIGFTVFALIISFLWFILGKRRKKEDEQEDADKSEVSK